MKLWTFLFTEKRAPLQSARVAAPTKAEARMMLESAAGPLPAEGDGLLAQYAGEVDSAVSEILRVVTRDGRVLEPTPEGEWHEAGQP